MTNDAAALFDVTGHFEMSDWGAVVTGHARKGEFLVGMLVRTGDEPPVLTDNGSAWTWV